MASLTDLADVRREADRLGELQEEIDRRNSLRRAKGLKPLPSLSEMEDRKVSKVRYSSFAPAVDGDEAIRLYQMRKAEMSGKRMGIEDQVSAMEAEIDAPPAPPPPPPESGMDSQSPQGAEADRAVREAEAARRVQDLKDGCIDHKGTWSLSLDGAGGAGNAGNAGEGVQDAHSGNATAIPAARRSDGGGAAEGNASPIPSYDGMGGRPGTGIPTPPGSPAPATPPSGLQEFRAELYKRLGTSFDALERSLSDLQGRVSEIVTATTPKDPPPEDGMGAAAFRELLERKTPVTFDVGGTRMSFDAICVFSAPPCITVVTRIGSAKITPKPGAQLLLTYDMDGVHYDGDPVTFLGTRFDLPMFDLSFVGFIRDREADMMDATPSSNDPATNTQ